MTAHPIGYGENSQKRIGHKGVFVIFPDPTEIRSCSITDLQRDLIHNPGKTLEITRNARKELA
jgi:hypothetical protein